MDEEERKVFAHLAARLQRLQRLRGISVADLASRSGIGESEIELILKGEIDLQLHVLYRLAGALEVRPTRLLQGIEWIPDGPLDGQFGIEEDPGAG